MEIEFNILKDIWNYPPCISVTSGCDSVTLVLCKNITHKPFPDNSSGYVVYRYGDNMEFTYRAHPQWHSGSVLENAKAGIPSLTIKNLLDVLRQEGL